MAVSIGTDTVEGVEEGTGIGIVFGVLFSSSVVEGGGIRGFDGVVYGMLLLDSVLSSVLGCALLRSSNMVLSASDAAVEDIGEKGFRIMGDESISRGLKDCFLMGSPAMSSPLAPALKTRKNGKNSLKASFHDSALFKILLGLPKRTLTKIISSSWFY